MGKEKNNNQNCVRLAGGRCAICVLPVLVYAALFCGYLYINFFIRGAVETDFDVWIARYGRLQEFVLLFSLAAILFTSLWCIRKKRMVAGVLNALCFCVAIIGSFLVVMFLGLFTPEPKPSAKRVAQHSPFFLHFLWSFALTMLLLTMTMA